MNYSQESPALLKIRDWVKSTCDPDLISHTRIHPIPLSQKINTQTWLKREDETAFGMPGSKRRKYASLIPFLLKQGFHSVVLIGGAYSHHLVAIAQLLNEHHIHADYLLRGEPELAIEGNQFLLRLLVPSDHLHWVPRNEWEEVDTRAATLAEKKREQGQKVFIIPEGAYTPWALPGLMSLQLDILENEKNHNIFFSHIICDAGTGLTAMSLLLSDAAIGIHRTYHIVLMAGEEKSFMDNFQLLIRQFEISSSIPINILPNYYLYSLPKNMGFGKMPTEIKSAILKYAREFGVITDPIYSAKLLWKGEKIIQENNLSGDILLIHSGGNSIYGVMDLLKPLL